MNFLITRPDHDDVVFYLFEWSKELIEKAKAKGINVLDCFGKRANKKDVEKIEHATFSFTTRNFWKKFHQKAFCAFRAKALGKQFASQKKWQ